MKYVDKISSFVPKEFRDEYSAPHATLDSGETIDYTIPRDEVLFPFGAAAERLGHCYANVAHFAIASSGLYGLDSSVSISVARGAILSGGIGWHEDGVDMHTGRITVSDRLPTLVYGKSTAPWQVVRFGPQDSHSTPENPDGIVRTRLTLTRWPNYATERQNDQEGTRTYRAFIVEADIPT